MYIDFQKFNYSTIPASDRTTQEEQDKIAYRNILRDWFEANLDDFISRKWEIEEIHYVRRISDFIKPVREAESLYELGFYTGCIALVGVAAEDFMQYFATELGKNSYVGQSQDKRLKNLHEDGDITQTTYDELDGIRKIRNDCIHYKNSFKAKSDSDLKSDAIDALNKLKSALQALVGVTLSADPNEFKAIIQELAANSPDARSFDEVVMKQRNAFSHLFGVSTIFPPGTSTQARADVFEVLDLDLAGKEVDLRSLTTGFPVIVDIDKENKAKFVKAGIEEGDIIFCGIVSDPDKFGQTAAWRFVSVQKVTLD